MRQTDLNQRESSIEFQQATKIDHQAKAFISDIEHQLAYQKRKTIVVQNDQSPQSGKAMIRVKKKDSDHASQTRVVSPTRQGEPDSPLDKPNAEVRFGYIPAGRRRLKTLTTVPVVNKPMIQENSEFKQTFTQENEPKREVATEVNLKAASVSPVRKMPDERAKNLSPMRLETHQVQESCLKNHNTYHSFLRRKKEARKTQVIEIIKQHKAKTEISWKTDCSEDWPDVTDQIKIGFKMGQGGFGTVYEGFDHELQESVAIKVIEKRVGQLKPSLQKIVQSEINIHSSLPDHENVCKFYRVIETQWQVSDQ